MLIAASTAPARRPLERVRTEPFRDAEQAWFWTMGVLAARRDGGSSSSGPRVARPPADRVAACPHPAHLGRTAGCARSGLSRRGLRCAAVARGDGAAGMAAAGEANYSLAISNRSDRLAVSIGK